MNELYVTRLSTFRKAHKLTQQSFSEKISISSEHFSKIESMCKNPSLSLHIEICKQLNVPSDCFFSERHLVPVLSCRQFEALSLLKTAELKALLNLLQTLYEGN